MDGRIKLHRKLLENPLSSNILLLGLWSFILLHTNYKNTEFYLGLQKISLKKGQLLFSQKKRASQFKISTGGLNKYLKLLANEKFIETKGYSKYTIVTILNRDKYQDKGTQSEHRVNTEGTQSETYNKYNNINKEKNRKKEEAKAPTHAFIKELEIFIKRRNEVKPFGLAKKGLPKNKKITDILKKLWIKKRKEYEYDEIVEGVSNYIGFMKDIKPQEGSDYYQHRFTIYEFLKQSNGLDKHFNS